MKKMMKALSLLIVAAAMFTSCSLSSGSDSSSGKDEKVDLCKQLFSKNDTKVQIWKFEIADGSWTFRSYETSDGKKESATVYFTYTNGSLDYTKSVKLIHQSKYSKEVPNSVVEKLKSEDYKKYDDSFWYKEITDANKIKEISEKEYTDLSTDFDKAIRQTIRLIPANNETYNPGITNELKTNSDHNKYYWEGMVRNTYRYLKKD